MLNALASSRNSAVLLSEEPAFNPLLHLYVMLIQKCVESNCIW
ncbi:MAG: hypothetical protein QXE95_04245 [Candidatus Nitrosocaldus sp.]